VSPRLVYRPLRWRPSDVDYLTAGETLTLCDTIPALDGPRGYHGTLIGRYAYVRNEAGMTTTAGLDEIIWTCDHELLAALSTMVTREVDARCRDCGALVRIGCEDRPTGYVDGERAA
jgi:hypothetical protein